MTVNLDSLIWDTSDPDFPHWRARDGWRLLVDARSLPQCASYGTQFPLRSFVESVSPSVASSGIHIADGVQSHVSTQAKIDLKRELRLGENIVASLFDDVLIESMTRFYDPTGQTMWKPLRGSHRSGFQLHLGKFSRREAFNANPKRGPVHPAWAGTLAVFQADYRRNREFDLVRGSDHYRKILGAASIAYRVPWQQLVEGMGKQIQSERPTDPDTKLTDPFTRGNQVGLGTSAEGWSWVEFDTSGQIDIVSNQAEYTATGPSGWRANSDLSSDNHYSEIELININGSNGHLGPIFRKDSDSTLTFYLVLVRQTGTPDNWETFKRITGTYTAIGTNNGVNFSVNDTLRGEANASTIRRLRNGSQQDAANDTAITGLVQTGIHYDRILAECIADNFEAADLVSVLPKGSLPLLGVGR